MNNKEDSPENPVEYVAMEIDANAYLHGDSDSEEYAEYLVEWYNVLNPSYDDLDLLVELVGKGDVYYSNCSMCSDDGFKAVPDDWGNFQGVYQGNDFSCQEVPIIDKHVSICDDCYQNLKSNIS